MSANVCPFCGAVRKPYNPMHREAYTCGTWNDWCHTDPDFHRHTQSRECIKSERERLTRERYAAIARAKRLEEAGDRTAEIVNSKSVLWTDDDLDAASNAWTKAKEDKP